MNNINLQLLNSASEFGIEHILKYFILDLTQLNQKTVFCNNIFYVNDMF